VTHPAVLQRRVHDAFALGVAAAIAALVAMGIAVAVPKPNVLLVLVLFVGVMGVLALMMSNRLPLTVAILAVYLGLLDGPVKLGIGGGGGEEATSAVRNVLIMAVALGAVLRLVVKRERIRFPPLSAWAMGFTALVLIEAFNPRTTSLLKVLGGYRQQLQWVPFFFFAYALMRSKDRFRQFAIILGVIALANGIVATYQTQISPGQLAAWGPGYKLRVEGREEELASGAIKHRGARKFFSEGSGGVRPMALGADSGFGAGVGLVALPCALALIATTRGRRRWIGILLCMGALIGIATGLGRIQVVGAAIAVLSFLLLASAAHRMKGAIAVVLGVALLAIPVGAVFVSVTGGGMFSRYEKILEANPTGTCKDCKKEAIGIIPHEISVAPFGVGLGTVGAAGAFGGKSTELLEGHGVTSETQYNFITNELGAPGLILWGGFSILLIVLVVRRLPRVADTDMRIYLAGLSAPLVALFIMGFSGPITASAVLGPYFWFAAGVVAYWFGGAARLAPRASPNLSAAAA
jgi:hypothetical protein